MMTIKKTEKQPNARPGGDGDPAGSITIEPPKHEDGGDSDNLEG